MDLAETMASDSDLDSIRDDPRFGALMAELEPDAEDRSVADAFRSQGDEPLRGGDE